MTGFDLVLVAIVIASMLLAMIHGIIKEIFSLASWIVGLGAAVIFAGTVGAWFPQDMLGTPHLRYLVAFLLILVAVLVIGALLGTLLKSGVRAIGLGMLDRIAGGVFGALRGVLIAMIVVLVFASTSMAAEPWFANSRFVPKLIVGASVVQKALPPAWGGYLEEHFGNKPKEPAAAGKDAPGKATTPKAPAAPAIPANAPRQQTT